MNYPEHDQPRVGEDQHVANAEATWLAVVRAYQTCTRRYEQLLALIDLTPSQFDVLLAIRRLGDDAQPKSIAEHLLVTRGNVTGLLDRLARRGWIRILPHPRDGRARIVRLRTPGQRMLRRARPLAQAFIQAQMAPFDREELESTRILMDRMQRHLEDLDPLQLVENERDSDEPQQSALL